MSDGDWDTEYIESLETELANVREQAWAWEQTAKTIGRDLAVWQRHGVKVTEDCERCGGSKVTQFSNGKGMITEGRCPDCGGSGKKPRDGVQLMRELLGGIYYGIPAEWLEAE